MEKKEKTIKQKSLWQEIWKNKAIYLIMLPGIIWFIVFSYGPMSGLQLAFKTYSMKQGIWGSPWCGLENFQYVFRDPSFLKSVGTTLWINAGRLIFQFPIPIILALLMNELRMKRYKKIVQTVLTFPHFLSWVIVASIAINVLSYDGLLNSLILSLGGETVNFTGNAKLFQPLLYITENWKWRQHSIKVFMHCCRQRRSENFWKKIQMKNDLVLGFCFYHSKRGCPGNKCHR